MDYGVKPEERIEILEQQNRMLRRCMFHTVRMAGGQIAISHVDLVHYSELDEVLNWYYDQDKNATVWTAKPLPKPAIVYGSGEPVRLSLREVLSTYRIIFGEVWRAFKHWKKERKDRERAH